MHGYVQHSHWNAHACTKARGLEKRPDMHIIPLGEGVMSVTLREADTLSTRMIMRLHPTIPIGPCHSWPWDTSFVGPEMGW